jgi:hypothetical protein
MRQNIITAIVQRAPFWIHNEWSFKQHIYWNSSAFDINIVENLQMENKQKYLCDVTVLKGPIHWKYCTFN